MTENLKVFLEAVSDDRAWLEGLSELADKGAVVDATVAKAAELGIVLTAADFEPPADEGELSEDELATVAGGGPCSCMIGGGGTAQDATTCPYSGYDDYACGCVVYGQGNTLEKSPSGDEPVESIRCLCPLAGSGEGNAR